ncbi:hypothetical protein FA13DRAFT_601717 [Coprinellus micaceus]|uniref:Uncharacterized protein n=1 Tax=Coprinellus micaceus TaxID=71717 RepID=A0A4Y7T6U8_COPMI|nr:hypothetical protein FA13DRAFT_601717 [Coprinellus micaceus]
MLSLTRGAMTVHSPASRHPLGVGLKWLGSPVALRASRIHLRLHARATSSSAVETAGSSSLGKKKERRFVATLDPGRLRSEDLLNLSGLSQPRICFPCKDAPSSASPYDTARLAYRYISGSLSIVPFPADTQGFLYFHQSPHSHPAAGEVRFRVVRPEDSSLPTREAFSRGSDLTLDHRHNLWGVHLTVVLRKYPVIWRKLISDGIIPPSRAAELEGLVPKHLRGRSRVLDSITDPFILGLAMETTKPCVLILRSEGLFQSRLHLNLGRPPRGRVISGIG